MQSCEVEGLADNFPGCVIEVSGADAAPRPGQVVVDLHGTLADHSAAGKPQWRSDGGAGDGGTRLLLSGNSNAAAVDVGAATWALPGTHALATAAGDSRGTGAPSAPFGPT